MSLTPDCLAQLKLRQAPFEAVPNAAFLYTDPLLESLVETALRALAAAGAIVMLAGADGAGRSIQLMRLLGGLGEQFEIIAFRGRANIPFAAVEATIRNHLHTLGLDHPEQALRELLAERGRSGVALVLAIDDAHLLGAESIDRLLRLRTEIFDLNRQGLRLILVGDPTLNRNRLPLPDSADANQVVRLNLRPFNLEQAGAYLRHRLRVAGVDDPVAFLTSGDIAALQSSGKGIPAALNAHANAWLIRRCRSASGVRQSIVGKISQLITPTSVAAAPSVAAPPALPLTPSRLMAADNSPLAPQPPSLPAPELPLPRQLPPHPAGILDLDDRLTLSQPASPELSRFLVQEETRSELSDFDRVLSQIRNSQLPPLATPQPQKAAAKQSLAALTQMMNRSWFIPAVLGIVVLAIVVPVVWQLDDSAPPSSPLPVAPVTPVTPRGQPSELTPAANDAPTRDADTPRADPHAAAGDGVPPLPTVVAPEVVHPRQFGALATEEPRLPPPVAAPAPPVVTPPVKNDLDADQDWLKRQDLGRFTIQLIAARTLTIANEFIATHQVDGVRMVKTRSFMVVVMGSYPNRAAAETAVRTLPAAVRASGPWIRTIGSVLESQR